jgi:hypothetical protein
MFCSIVGHASRQTAATMGPSMIDRSNLLGLTPALDTVAEFTTGPLGTQSISDFGFLIFESLKD